MTEFITRNHGNSCFEIIIKTTNPEHYKATEDFARRLIDHAKPMTNADRIRAMSDEELASFMAGKGVSESYLRLKDKGYTPTATELALLNERLMRPWMAWLLQPVEGE